MQFVHIADNHLGYRHYNLDEREMDIYENFNECIDKIIEIKPDFVIHSGDLFNDLRPQIEALRIAIEGFRKLKDMGIRVYIVAGNHEMPRRRNRKSPIILLKDYVKILNGYVLEGDIFIAGTYYHNLNKKEELRNKIKEFEIKGAGYKKKILALHQGINKYLPYDYELEINELPSFSYYALGHVHNRVLERFNDGILAYAGSTEIIRIDEYESYKKDGKGFYLVDFSKGDIDISDVDKINLECRDIIKAEIKTEKDLLEVIKEINNAKKKPILIGKIKEELRHRLDIIKDKILINKLIPVEEKIFDEIDTVETLDIKELLIKYANNNKLNGEFVYLLYRKLINNEDWRDIVDNFYKNFM
ncbi:metallophosphoesterase [Methanocaldococcus villosus KIN24-T80]|uniref:DNA double-strand break repair protein Mre11 n=1 Tax=Methanocaldococcus villosus KIN24-T80 TaxID=1069083 RepID=N6VRH7_9EURY|nr:DNA repair exonuclease [Methanocaldococcus villosus]ENN96490.1 metallophosphoesterase [Methanocaldococcus villosus KIN24-T80]